MEVTRCRFGSTSRQAAPPGCQDFIPQKEWTPIFHAVFYDREAALQHFLQAGVSPDITESSGVPLLCIAAACGHFEIAEMLLKAGADIDSVSKDKGEAAIHVAIRTGRHEITDLLLVHRANLESKTFHNGQTALHYAAAGPNSLAMVTKLLKFGAKYDVKDMQGQTPAVVAMQAHNIQAAVAIVNMARGKRKQLVKEKDMLMQHVCKAKDRTSVSNDLIANAFTATCDPDSTVLIEAIKKNDSVLVQMFLEEGFDAQQATATGLLPLIVAVKFADLRIVKLLIHYGANVTARGPGNLDILQILFKTLATRDEDSVVAIVEYLLAKGADGMALYPDGKTLLHRSVNVRADYAKVVKLLIKSGLRMDVQDKDGNTALHLAASNGLVRTTNVLLDYHVDTTMIDLHGRTALLCAIKNHQWLIVPLLAVSPTLTSWDLEGSTALHNIARSTPTENDSWEDIATAAKAFCVRGICRSMRDRAGATPLIQAIKSLPEDGLPVVEMLLTAGEMKWNCVGHEDHKGHNALYYAATSGKVVFVEALLEHGAPFVLEEWTSERLEDLPATSRDRILDILTTTNCSQKAQMNGPQHDNDNSWTRIEIVRSEPRSSSALSGYHADCEMERKTKGNRSTTKKPSAMRHLQLPIQQRRAAAGSKIFPTRTTSIQQHSRVPIVQVRTAVNPSYARKSSSSSLNQSVLSNSKTVHFTQHVEMTGPTPSAQKSRNAMDTSPSRTASRGVLKKPVKETSRPSQPPEVPAETTSMATPMTSVNQQEAARPLDAEQSTFTIPEITTKTTKPTPTSLSTAPTATRGAQPTRIDSGVSLPSKDCAADVLSVLERPQPIVNSTAPSTKRQSGDELKSWLAISNMLDRL